MVPLPTRTSPRYISIAPVAPFETVTIAEAFAGYVTSAIVTSIVGSTLETLKFTGYDLLL